MLNELKNAELKISYAREEIKDYKRSSFKVTNSKQAYDHFLTLFDQDDINYRESFFALYFSRKMNIIGWKEISRGGRAGTVADPSIIAKGALDTGATSVMIGHNHPSGNLKPSNVDITLTEKLKNGLKFLDINLIDHLIISDEGYLSFNDEGHLSLLSSNDQRKL